jgi:4'-phosphopantetheinyl transferase
MRAVLRSVAEAALCEATGATRVVRLCPHCGSSGHGQPRLIGSDLAVSIAYAGRLAVVAWGRGPLGVDVEALGDSSRDLAEWTRVEALAKAAGTGLRDWPEVTLPDLPTTPLDLPPGYVGTLAGEAAGVAVVTAPPLPDVIRPGCSGDHLV